MPIRYKILFLLPLLITFSITKSYGQQEEIKESSNQTHNKFDLGFEGMLGVSVGPELYTLNVGGPSFRLRINETVKVGIGALPSLYLYKNTLRASLGVSPRIDYKNLVFIAPFLNLRDTESLDGSYKFVWSLGIGYKFGKH